MKPKYQLARTMRRNLTPLEFRLWQYIGKRNIGAPCFRRQYAIGSYVLDFYCIKAKLAVEVDGQTHSHDAAILRDNARDEWLQSQGIMVYRIGAIDVFQDVESVALGIYDLALRRLKVS